MSTLLLLLPVLLGLCVSAVPPAQGVRYSGAECTGVVQFGVTLNSSAQSATDAAVRTELQRHVPVWLAEPCRHALRVASCLHAFTPYHVNASARAAVCDDVCEDLVYTRPYCGDIFGLPERALSKAVLPGVEPFVQCVDNASRSSEDGTCVGLADVDLSGRFEDDRTQCPEGKTVKIPGSVDRTALDRDLRLDQRLLLYSPNSLKSSFFDASVGCAFKCPNPLATDAEYHVLDVTARVLMAVAFVASTTTFGLVVLQWRRNSKLEGDANSLARGMSKNVAYFAFGAFLYGIAGLPTLFVGSKAVRCKNDFEYNNMFGACGFQGRLYFAGLHWMAIWSMWIMLELALVAQKPIGSRGRLKKVRRVSFVGSLLYIVFVAVGSIATRATTQVFPADYPICFFPLVTDPRWIARLFFYETLMTIMVLDVALLLVTFACTLHWLRKRDENTMEAVINALRHNHKALTLVGLFAIGFIMFISERHRFLADDVLSETFDFFSCILEHSAADPSGWKSAGCGEARKPRYYPSLGRFLSTVLGLLGWAFVPFIVFGVDVIRAELDMHRDPEDRLSTQCRPICLCFTANAFNRYRESVEEQTRPTATARDSNAERGSDGRLQLVATKHDSWEASLRGVRTSNNAEVIT